MEELYSINESGIIYSKRNNKYLKPKLTNSGYLQIQIGRGNYFYIHRLVGANFLSNPENKKTINHKDGNKLNNHVDNLEWATYSENHKHAYTIELKIPNSPMKNKFGVNNPVSKKIAQLNLTGDIINVFHGVYEAYRNTGISKGNINSVCNNKRMTAGGFKWQYV